MTDQIIVLRFAWPTKEVIRTHRPVELEERILAAGSYLPGERSNLLVAAGMIGEVAKNTKRYPSSILQYRQHT
jgi:hypothetical protein